MKCQEKIILISITCLIIAFFIPWQALAIEIVSNPVEVKDALRGQEIKDKLMMKNTEEIEVIYELTAVGDITDWVIFYEEDPASPITETLIPAQSNKEVNVLITVPTDIPNADYQGMLTITYDPSKNEQLATTTAVTVRQQVSREVFITITDQERIEFDSSVTPKNYILEKDQALEINAIYYNNGNIIIKPDLQLKVSKDGNNIYNSIFPFPEDEEAVKPLESKTIMVEYKSAGLEKGEYRAEVVVLLDNEEKHRDDFSFTVGMSTEEVEEAVKEKKSFFSFLTYAQRLMLMWGLLIVVVIFTVLFIRKFLKAKQEVKSMAAAKPKPKKNNSRKPVKKQVNNTKKNPKPKRQIDGISKMSK